MEPRLMRWFSLIRRRINYSHKLSFLVAEWPHVARPRCSSNQWLPLRRQLCISCVHLTGIEEKAETDLTVPPTQHLPTQPVYLTIDGGIISEREVREYFRDVRLSSSAVQVPPVATLRPTNQFAIRLDYPHQMLNVIKCNNRKGRFKILPGSRELFERIQFKNDIHHLVTNSQSSEESAKFTGVFLVRVMNVATHLTEEDVEQFFDPLRVIDVQFDYFALRPETLRQKSNQGIAWVRFGTRGDAQKAVHYKNGTSLADRPVMLRLFATLSHEQNLQWMNATPEPTASPADRCFAMIGGLHYRCSLTSFKRHFRDINFAPDGIHLMRKKDGICDGDCYVHMQTTKDVTKLFSNYNRTWLFKRCLSIQHVTRGAFELARIRSTRDEEVLRGRLHLIKLIGLPKDATEDEIYTFLHPFVPEEVTLRTYVLPRYRTSNEKMEQLLDEHKLGKSVAFARFKTHQIATEVAAAKDRQFMGQTRTILACLFSSPVDTVANKLADDSADAQGSTVGHLITPNRRFDGRTPTMRYEQFEKRYSQNRDMMYNQSDAYTPIRRQTVRSRSDQNQSNPKYDYYHRR